jgi:hypothetical protein
MTLVEESMASGAKVMVVREARSSVIMIPRTSTLRKLISIAMNITGVRILLYAYLN